MARANANGEASSTSVWVPTVLVAAITPAETTLALLRSAVAARSTP